VILVGDVWLDSSRDSDSGKTFAAWRRSTVALSEVFVFLARAQFLSITNLRLVAMAMALILLLTSLGDAKVQVNRSTPGAKLLLQKGWSVQSSALINQKGDVVSLNTFVPPTKWYPATVPSTVVGTLVENKVYADPLFGMNLRLIPGCTYPIGQNFSNLPMPDDSPFRSSWWYRTRFSLPTSYRGQQIWLHFDGINFRANVWLNGKLVAAADEIAGTFRVYELNITDLARVGALNTLAVEVFPPNVDDLAWTWVDWNPSPPDKNMGIFREVYITTSGPVTLRYPQVVSNFDLPSLDAAHLTVNAETHNASRQTIEGTLTGRIGGIRFSQAVALGPLETKSITFTPRDFPQLNFKRPRVWWPINQGPQNMYDLEMEFESSGKVSDRQTARFGIREITSRLNKQHHRIFTVNGKDVLIRGGGWASDLFLRFSPERIKSEFQYIKDMNLNLIRLEGQLQPNYFFDLADEYGILIMAGWCCCSHWEHWQHRPDYEQGPTWKKEDYEIAAKSQADQIKRLRNHPSMLAWLNGSDNPPPPDVEKMYLNILKRLQWPNPVLSSATAKETAVTGATGVKMEGPYEWVPPAYWSVDKRAGGAYAFATEVSPGPAVPPIESLRRMIPKEHLWPIDQVWNYHAGGGQFKDLAIFTEALNARYGTAKDAQDYALKAQLMAYEGQRAMFEAYARNRYVSTGVVQWMLNNAWPSLIWHLYDFFLMPGGGYFGTKKACEPVHAQYSYDDRSVVVINTKHQPIRDLKLTAQVFDINFAERFSRIINVEMQPDSNLNAFVIPEITDLSPTYFVRLALEDRGGRMLSSNFYWLSIKDDVLELQKSKWYYTPVSSFADMTQLQQLPSVKLSVSGNSTRQAGVELATVTITNPSRALAFFIRLRVKRGLDGRDVLPILWDDNYFSLAPNERKQITARYSARELGNTAPFIAVEGWNVSSDAIRISPGRSKANYREKHTDPAN
jgi:exo-1,4-beta-D-glucosaminidase